MGVATNLEESINIPNRKERPMDDEALRSQIDYQFVAYCHKYMSSDAYKSPDHRKYHVDDIMLLIKQDRVNTRQDQIEIDYRRFRRYGFAEYYYDELIEAEKEAVAELSPPANSEAKHG